LDSPFFCAQKLVFLKKINEKEEIMETKELIEKMDKSASEARKDLDPKTINASSDR